MDQRADVQALQDAARARCATQEGRLMAWLEIHQSLWRHRKTIRLVAALEIPRAHAVGLCAGLWMWGLDNAETTGRLRGISAPDIAAAVDWPVSDADRLLAALVDAGFITSKTRGLFLRNWPVYTAKFHNTRLSSRIRKQKERARKRENESNSHATVTRDNRDSHALPSRPSDRQTDPPTVPPAGGGVSAKPTTRSADKPRTKNADTIVLADLRGPPYDIIAACDTYIGRCIWDWYPQLAEMKAKYTAEELEHGFTECAKRRGKTPSYVVSVIEGSRTDAQAGGPVENGKRDPTSLANAPTFSEYQAAIAARGANGA